MEKNKLIKVELTFDTEHEGHTIMKALYGEDAQRWYKAVNNALFMDALHGHEGEPIEWKEVLILDAKL